MVEIDLEYVNSIAPYKVMEDEKPLKYYFVTSQSAVYKVEFTQEFFFESSESYQFSITNTRNAKSPRDIKLRETVIALIYAFFKSSNTAMLYICDTGDGRQNMRDRLFRFWFESSKFGAAFSTITATIKDEEGIDNYATLILRPDHPRAADVMMEFKNLTDVLNIKPEN